MTEFRLQTTGGGVHSGEFGLDELDELTKGKGCAWLDIYQPDEKVKDFLLNEMGFDELAVDGIGEHSLNTVQRFDDLRFLVVSARDRDKRLDTEPLAIFLQNQLMITIHFSRIRALTPFKKRYKRADPEDIELGIDYFFYELLDSIADDWTPLLDEYSNELDELEYRVFDPTMRYDNLLEELHILKQNLREASKSIESLHSATMRLVKPGDRLISTETLTHFTALHNLVLTLMKRNHNYSAGATSTRDTYLTNASLSLAKSNQRLTEVMTTLTIIGAIMLPLTLVAGIFGMNTKLPVGADSLGGFWVVMAIMASFGIMMLFWFRRRGWFEKPGEGMV
jgi:magnesium transporter